MQRRKRRREGMTLIEVIVVMVIMATMAAAAAFGIMKAWTTAKINDTKTRARTIQSAATAYMLEGNECPTVEDLARSNTLDPTTQHTDGWNRPFAITCDETVVHVLSPGPDGHSGNEDDIGF